MGLMQADDTAVRVDEPAVLPGLTCRNPSRRNRVVNSSQVKSRGRRRNRSNSLSVLSMRAPAMTLYQIRTLGATIFSCKPSWAIMVADSWAARSSVLCHRRGGPHLPVGPRNLPCAASQASRAVSAMRALRPRCTTGSWPVHSSRVKVSGLTPNQRCASSRGISWGGGGSSRGRSSWRADGRRLGRRCWDGAAMAGASPHRCGTCDAVNRDGRQPQIVWADPGATGLRKCATILSIFWT
jgi:hypothetical protein